MTEPAKARRIEFAAFLDGLWEGVVKRTSSRGAPIEVRRPVMVEACIEPTDSLRTIDPVWSFDADIYKVVARGGIESLPSVVVYVYALDRDAKISKQALAALIHDCERDAQNG